MAGSERGDCEHSEHQILNNEDLKTSLNESPVLPPISKII